MRIPPSISVVLFSSFTVAPLQAQESKPGMIGDGRQKQGSRGTKLHSAANA